jgi:hypothetical protein
VKWSCDEIEEVVRDLYVTYNLVSAIEKKWRKFHTFPCTLEEEPDDEHLETSHRNHHKTDYAAEVEDSLLGRADGAQISILSCSEVFLIS